jgi:hypothetical protein
MSKKSTAYILLIASALLALAACASLNGGFGLTGKHLSAEDLGTKPMNCLDCHEAKGDPIPFGRFVHNSYFMENHRQEAYQYEQVCSFCHQTSFCNDCHATRVELKPSIKNQTDTDRRMQHRGDYLSRHRIDGRIDPTSCFRCHGNPKNAQTCAPCHG